MNEPLIDFDFLNEISGGDSRYIYEVLEIFLSNTPDGVNTLEKLLRETDDWDAIYKQAHFLKSSVGIIKIRGAYEQLVSIEAMGRAQAKNAELGKPLTGKEEFIKLLDGLVETFREAIPVLIAERDKNKPPEEPQLQ